MEKLSTEIIRYFPYNFLLSSLFVMSPDTDSNMYRVLLISTKDGMCGSHPPSASLSILCFFLQAEKACPEFLYYSISSTLWC